MIKNEYFCRLFILKNSNYVILAGLKKPFCVIYLESQKKIYLFFMSKR